MKKLIFILILISSKAVMSQPAAFVINNLAETMSRIDLVTGQVQNHIVVLGDTPNQIAYYGGYLYVINSISANLQKIELESYQIVADIPLPIGSNPYALAFDSIYAYVSGWISGKIYRVNLAIGAVDNELDIGGFPEGIFCFGEKLFAAQTGFNPGDFSYGQGRVAKIDLSSFTLDNEINTGKNPQSIILAPDTTLHIICTGNYADITGSIDIYDPILGAMVDSIVIGGQPAGGALSPGGIAFLAAGGWTGQGLIYSYNAIMREVLHNSQNPIFSGIGVTAVAFDSAGYLYSSNFGDDSVTRLNQAGQVLGTYSLGDGPQSIVVVDDRAQGVIDHSMPQNIYLLRSYPNPFNSSTQIEYHLAESNNVADIAIYDILGKSLRTLPLDSKRKSGSIIWDGRDRDGNSCPSGLYFARLILLKESQNSINTGNSIKLVLVK
jgi:hypothetical protein